MTLKVDGIQQLTRILRGMPDTMRVRIARPALQRSGKILARSIRGLVPVQQKPGRGRKRAHYRDVVTEKVVDFPKSGNVVVLAGPESRQAPHANLVESGTVQRFTNSKPVYRRVAVGVRKVVKNGKLVTKADKRRMAVGSKDKKKGAVRRNRGVMAAYRPIKRGSEAVASEIAAQLRQDIEAGIKREFTAAQLGRGQ